MSEQCNRMGRREFLGRAGAAAAGAVLSGALRPFEGLLAADDRQADLDKYDLILPRVKFRCLENVPDDWSIHPIGDVNLLREFASVARCKIKTQPAGMGRGSEENFNAVVDFDDFATLSKYPIAFMTAEGHYTFTSGQKANLKRYISEGGFLLMDDCVFLMRADYFYQSSFKLLEDVFGMGATKRIPNSHEVFHNVHDMGDSGLPHVQGVQHGARGIFVGDRLGVFLSPSDIHCAWAGHFPNTPPYRPAFKMGVNILMYAMTH